MEWTDTLPQINILLLVAAQSWSRLQRVELHQHGVFRNCSQMLDDTDTDTDSETKIKDTNPDMDFYFDR